jgi:hypothetical protein
MNLASLPGRPLSLDECRDLEESGRFRTLVPAGVFDLAESDRRLVPAVVLVTESTVVAAGYVLAVDAAASGSGPDEGSGNAGSGDAGTDEDTDPDPDAEAGWTAVAEREAPAETEALEDEVRAVGAELRSWAERQAWADDPSALLDAL